MYHGPGPFLTCVVRGVREQVSLVLGSSLALFSWGGRGRSYESSFLILKKCAVAIKLEMFKLEIFKLEMFKSEILKLEMFGLEMVG